MRGAVLGCMAQGSLILQWYILQSFSWDLATLEFITKNAVTHGGVCLRVYPRRRRPVPGRRCHFTIPSDALSGRSEGVPQTLDART
jgi:hypothetical protein